MRLTPRYGDRPLIVLGGDPWAVAQPAIRQRRRLAEALLEFSDDQWAHPSRCEGWSARDVVVHLETTNTFWTFSIQAGLGGEPTRLLDGFDPVASPAKMVANAEVSIHELRDRFAESTRALVDLLESLDEADWSALAEAPPGHQSIGAVVHHALWDSWVHERDVLLPQGAEPPVEDDEVVASLAYVAALAPAFAINSGSAGRGVLLIDVDEPDAEITLEIDDHVEVVAHATLPPDLRLTGRAVDLVEALSMRRALEQGVPAETSWMLSGLATAFDAEPT